MPKNSLTQGQNYGDQTRLNSTKLASGTSGPIVQRTPTGRPAAGARVPVTPVVAPQDDGPPVPQEHIQLMQQYAQSMKADQRFSQMAQAADAPPWVLYYANLARQQLQEAAMRLKQSTPDFT